jgi:sRNA-binding regulator protein Hfq
LSGSGRLNRGCSSHEWPPCGADREIGVLFNVAQPKAKVSRPPEQTFEEIKYLKHLIDQKVPVCVKLSDDEEVRGVVEYYDQRFIRVTRAGAPNLFIFKHDIKYLYEVA